MVTEMVREKTDTAGGQNKTYKERDAETTDFTPREAERERQRRQGKDFKTVETENVSETKSRERRRDDRLHSKRSREGETETETTGKRLQDCGDGRGQRHCRDCRDCTALREKTLQGVKTKRIKRETQRRQTSLQEKQRERETETTGKRLQDCGDGKRLRDEKQRETQRRQTSLQEKQRGRDRDDREKTSRLWRRKT